MRSLKVYIVCFLLFLTHILFAQDVKSLEKQVEKLQKDIKTAEKILAQTSKSKQTTVNQVNLLKTQISQREKLIKMYAKQIDNVNKEIGSNRRKISSLNNELDDHRAEYANLIKICYNNRNDLNNLLFVFSADNYNTAMNRWRYIKQFRELLQKKMYTIDSLQTKVNDKLRVNEKVKKEKDALLAKEKTAQNELLKDKKKLDNQLAELKKKEKSINKDIAAKKKQQQDLKKKIEGIIAEDLKNTKSHDSNNVKLSGFFEQNKGKLPWPVAEGYVSQKYGTSQHPTQPKVKITNNGVDISTTRDAKVRAVFNGEVRMVFNTDNGTAVLIRHGNYFTLYSNLQKVFVKRGDNVKTSQEIGVVRTNSSDNMTILHFEVWKEKTTMNPEKWLTK